MTPKQDTRSHDGELLALLAAGGNLGSFLGDLVDLAARHVPAPRPAG